MTTLRTKLIRLAHETPALRPHLLPLLDNGKVAAGPLSWPDGDRSAPWTPWGPAQYGKEASVRNPLYPSSTRDTRPLDARTHESVWYAGYEAASEAATYAAKHGRPRRVAADDLFVMAAGKDRRIPSGINENHPQFWGYLGTFIEGAKAYAREHATDPDRMIVVR